MPDPASNMTCPLMCAVVCTCGLLLCCILCARPRARREYAEGPCPCTTIARLHAPLLHGRLAHASRRSRAGARRPPALEKFKAYVETLDAAAWMPVIQNDLQAMRNNTYAMAPAAAPAMAYYAAPLGQQPGYNAGPPPQPGYYAGPPQPGYPQQQPGYYPGPQQQPVYYAGPQQPAPAGSMVH